MAMSDNLLTEDERVRIRHHLGYVNAQEVQTFVVGTPASVETQFLIEGAFNYLKPQALPLVRRIINILDDLEGRMVCTLDNAEVNQVGDIALNNEGRDNNQNSLNLAYERWKGKLCNALGVSNNPFDKSTGFYRGRRGLNARVVG